jgi:hypothetical protein
MREGWHITHRRRGDGAGRPAGRCTLAVVGIVTVVLGGDLCVVGVVHARARDVTWETAERVIVGAAALTTAFELLATQTAGQQIR